MSDASLLIEFVGGALDGRQVFIPACPGDCQCPPPGGVLTSVGEYHRGALHPVSHAWHYHLRSPRGTVGDVPVPE